MPLLVVLSLAIIPINTCNVYINVACQRTIIIVGLNIFILMPATSVGRPRSAWISQSCHAYYLGMILTLWDNVVVKFFLHNDRIQYRVGAKSRARQANDGHLLNEST